MSFENYSTTPSANTSIAGQNIAPGGPPSAVGPGIRQLMADGKELTNQLVVTAESRGASTGASAATNNAILQVLINDAITSGFVIDIGNSGTFAITGLLVDAANGLTIRSSGARLTTTSNTPAIKIQNSTNVVLDGLRITGNAGSTDNAQSGLYFDTTSYCDVRNCRLENLSVGLYANNSATGYPLAGGVQLPSTAIGNHIRNCRRGAYFRDGGTSGTYGEYWDFHSNRVTDCTLAGVWVEAGNTSIVGNTVNGNSLGIVLFSFGGSNGDHGTCSMNKINHNVACGLYVGSNLRSWTIVGNNIWATLGGPSGTQKLGDFFGGANQGYAFGVYFDNVHNVTFTDNVVARNQFNMASNFVLESFIKQNQFLTDPASTIANTWDYTAGGFFYSTGNFFGPNVYSGSWTNTGTFPHNGDLNRSIAIGAAGAPAFTNSWVNYGSGFPAATFYKDGNGVVKLAGLIKAGTLNTSAFTLPIGFRPDATRSFASLSNSAAGGVQVLVSGEVNIVTPSSNVYVSLDGVSFACA